MVLNIHINEQSPLTLTVITEHKKVQILNWDRQAQTCGGVYPVNGIPLIHLPPSCINKPTFILLFCRCLHGIYTGTSSWIRQRSDCEIKNTNKNIVY